MPKKAKRKPRDRRPAPGSYDEHDAKLSDQERRVDEIVAKMQSGAWLTGVSERALAREWNVAPGTVRKLSQEASRVVRRYLRDDPEAQKDARAQIVQTFEVIRAKAMAKGDPASLRVALDATRALGFYMGVEPAKRLELGKPGDFMDGWTLEEKVAYAEQGKMPRRAIARAMDGADESGERGGMH